MKKLFAILLVVVGLMFGLIVCKNQIVRFVVQAGASSVLGAPVKIDSLSIGIIKTGIHVKGFRIYNPSGFPKGVLLDITEVQVDYDLPALVKGKIYVPLLVLDLKEMVIIKNKDGKLNVDALKVVSQQQKTKAGQPKQEKPEASAPKLDMKIDEARLNIGQVVVKDYTAGDEPSVKAYDVNLKNKVYKNIISAEQLAVLVMWEAMGPTALKGAGVYGAATLLGVGFLPVGVASLFIGSDSAAMEFSVSLDKAFQVAQDVLGKKGKVTRADKANGTIAGEADRSSITIEITSKEKNKAEIKVSARRFKMPRQETAQGLLYEIGQALK